jgi:hypothetical protein
MQFKWKIGEEYKFKDVSGKYKLLGIDGKTNYKYAYAVFVNEKENKRMRIKEMVAKDLVLHESNA